MKTDFIHEQGTGQINEDALSVNGSMFAVFDGATSLNGQRYTDGKTGGFYASHIASNVFSTNNDSLTNLADKANTAIYNKMVEKGINTDNRHDLWSTSAAVVRIKSNTAEWIQTGDSLLMLIYKDGSYHIPVKENNHDAQTLWLWQQLSEKTESPIYDCLEKQIKKVRGEMNRTYGVLNGEHTYDQFLNSGSHSLDGVSHILMFTDGLFIPSRNPAEKNDFDTFVTLFLDGGLPAVRNHVRELERSDPYCRNYPRFKPHDDIAAVAITL